MTNSKQTEALREARQPAPATELREQEPVAYAVYHRMGGSKSLHWTEQHSDDGDHNQYLLVPLYTSPPAQRKPLTDKEIMAIGKELGLKCRLGGNSNIDFDYARAIEAAHGIKGDA